MRDLRAAAPSKEDSTAPRDASILRCEGYGVAFGNKIILAEVDLEVRAPGVTTLMGPGGVGKSTLVNSLAGVIRSALHKSWGTVSYQGAPLAIGNCPAIVTQRIQLIQRSVLDNIIFRIKEEWTLDPIEWRELVSHGLEQLRLSWIADRLDAPFTDLDLGSQRIVAILREASTNPALLMVDEPTSGLSDGEAAGVLGLIEMLAERAAILVVLHNQKQARRVSKSIVLLAGGRVQAQTDTRTFFEVEENQIVQQFIATGSCAVPSPDAQPDTLASHIEPPPPLPARALATLDASSNQPTLFQPVTNRAVRRLANSIGPHGFVWVIEGRLAGTPHPGIIHQPDYDLELLSLAGVTTLVTLTENDLPRQFLESYGFDNLHCPIVDRKAPTLAQTELLLDRMRELLRQGKVLAVHCWAGAGRTGVVLASYLIREQALAAREALAQLRTLNPEFVQTAEQEAFLFSFEEYLQRQNEI
jgi:atypical dual specificity phosphatase